MGFFIFKVAFQLAIILLEYTIQKKMTDFTRIQNKIVVVINSVLGGFAGLIGLLLVITIITYFIKISIFADDHVKKMRYLNAIKWVFISFLGILIVWSISGLVINIIQTNLNEPVINDSLVSAKDKVNEISKIVEEVLKTSK